MRTTEKIRQGMRGNRASQAGPLALPTERPEGLPETGRDGLCEEEARRRAAAGQANVISEDAGKSLFQIIVTNVFTLFNLLNFALAFCLLLVGSYRNMLFLLIVAANTLVAIIQEVRAKKAIERMQLLNAPRVSVIRDGQEKTCPAEETVAGDLVVLRSGDQVPADALVVSGRGNAMEGLLTGESDAVSKEEGSWLYSGSYITEGRLYAQLIYVGDESYVGRLTRETHRARRTESGLMKELKKLIRWDSMALIPLGILLFLKAILVRQVTPAQAVPSTVAAMLGMIPEGLMLLTSVALAAGVVRLARQKVLVQELYGIEGLARINMLCLDKTGTITSGRMRLDDTLPMEAEMPELREALSRFLGAFDEQSSTLRALRQAVPSGRELPVAVLPFSSARKKSAASFQDGVTLVLGAPEFVLGEAFSGRIRQEAERLTREGKRVLVLAKCDGILQGDRLPEITRVLGIFALADELRNNAEKTIRYFREQGVAIRVISGDNPATVSRIARQAGVEGWELAVDAGQLKTEEELEAACREYVVFGRVTPAQKKQIVEILRRQGYCVGMTGDGVNDIPAMKAADCSIAMAEGTDAARHAAQLTLLESDFGVVPGIVLEGRRVINNVTRSASLFLTKTLYSLLLSLLTLVLPGAYPFQPIQLSLVSGLTVGIPGFFLSLEPSRERIKGDFLRKVILRALPGGTAIAVGALLAMHLTAYGFSESMCSTVATWMAGLICALVLWRTCIPLNPRRGAVAAASTIAFVVTAALFGRVFLLDPLTLHAALAVAGLTALGAVLVFGTAAVIRRKGEQLH